MSLTIAALQARIRKEAGSPKTDVVADTDITTWVTQALREFDRFYPAWKIFYLTTLADIASYAVDTTCLEVLFCDNRGGNSLQEVFGAGFNVIVSEGGDYGSFNYLDVETGRYDNLVRALKRDAVESTCDWEWNEAERKLYIIPPPVEAAKKIYYIGTVAWTLGTLPERFEQEIVLFSTAQAIRQKAEKLRRESAISYAGSPFPWSNADPDIEVAKGLETEFRIRMDRLSKLSILMWS
jgi:hypothetical protein